MIRVRHISGDVTQTITIRRAALATGAVGMLRYTMRSVAATVIAYEAAKQAFVERARQEQEHG